MIDRIRHRRRSADDADLAQTLYPDWAHDLVVLIDKNHVDLRHVGVHLHVVLGQVVVHEPAQRVVRHALLRQRHAQAEHDAPRSAPLTKRWHASQSVIAGDKIPQ